MNVKTIPINERYTLVQAVSPYGTVIDEIRVRNMHVSNAEATLEQRHSTVAL